ncbi:retrovirus-related pol polyprotein from transposon TNT 1-94 [Tanacetum coccineum]
MEQVCHNGSSIQNLHEVDFDQLYDYLNQNDNNVNALRAKRATRTHDPLALIANHYVVPSSSHTSPAYYVTHPTSVNDFDGDSQSYEFQRDACNDDPMDSLTTAMMLLAKAITHHCSTPTNNHLRYSSNTRNQGNAAYGQQANGNNVIVKRVPRTSANSGNTLIVKCYNCNEKGHLARMCSKPKVLDSNYFKEQMMLAKKDEVGIILTEEDKALLIIEMDREEELEELNV